MTLQLRRRDGPSSRHEIAGAPLPVARHQNAVELVADAPFFGPAAAPPRRPGQVTRALLRFQSIRFVCLDDAAHGLGTIILFHREKGLAPAKTRVAMDAGGC